MSTAFWGDLFYGVDRIKHSEIFDTLKERDRIIASLEDVWEKEEVEAIKGYDLSYDNVDELNLEDAIWETTSFLNGTGVAPYSCGSDVLFFGVNFVLPWEVEEIETKEEVDSRIYKSLKPILKDEITFEAFSKLLKQFVINGADDDVKYYDLDVDN